MAKTNLCKEAALDALRVQIKGMIAKNEAERNIPRAETIKHSGMSPHNFYKAWNDPSLFRVWQLVRIYDYLKVPEAERRYS